MNYETNSSLYDLCLDNFDKLEGLCSDNKYHFDSNIFVALHNEFTLQKRDKHVLLYKSGCTKVVKKGNALASLHAQSLVKKTALKDTKTILEKMFKNVDNEEAFSELFRQLRGKQNNDIRSIEHGIEVGLAVVNKHSSKRRVRKDRSSKSRRSKKQRNTSNITAVTPLNNYTPPIEHDREDGVAVVNEPSAKRRVYMQSSSKIKKSQKHRNTTNTTTVVPFSDTSSANGASGHNNPCDYSVNQKRNVEKELSICDDNNGTVAKRMNDGMNEHCNNLNVPNNDSDA